MRRLVVSHNDGWDSDESATERLALHPAAKIGLKLLRANVPILKPDSRHAQESRFILIQHFLFPCLVLFRLFLVLLSVAA